MNNYLSFEEWWKDIKRLAEHQGLYSWVWEKLLSMNNEELNNLKEEIESAQFHDIIDFCLSYEYGEYDPFAKG